jgi:hypothetical protein
VGRQLSPWWLTVSPRSDLQMSQGGLTVSDTSAFGADGVEPISAPAEGVNAEEQWRLARRKVPSLRVEVPDEVLAVALVRQLQPFGAETVEVDGHYEVGLELREKNSEQRVTKALSSIDAWLAGSGLPSVRIHVDGCTHTLHVLSSRLSGAAEARS